MKRTILGVLIMLVAVMSRADLAVAVDLQGLEVVDYGIYTLETAGQYEAENAVGGKATKVAESTLVKKTTQVPAEIGVEFGVSFKVNGEPQGESIDLTCIVAHPDMTGPDGTSTDWQEWVCPKNIGETSYIGYGFEEGYELVPGTWTFQIMQGGKVHLSKEFTVIKE